MGKRKSKSLLQSWNVISDASVAECVHKLEKLEDEQVRVSVLNQEAEDVPYALSRYTDKIGTVHGRGKLERWEGTKTRITFGTRGRSGLLGLYRRSLTLPLPLLIVGAIVIDALLVLSFLQLSALSHTDLLQILFIQLAVIAFLMLPSLSLDIRHHARYEKQVEQSLREKLHQTFG